MAFHPYATAVDISYFLTEGQADAAAGHTLESIFRSLREWFEYDLLTIFRHAYAVVLHHNAKIRFTVTIQNSHLNLSTIRGIFERI